MDLFSERRGLYWDGAHLHFIDQTLLPHVRETIVTEDWRVVMEAIRRLAIRGAPAIGVAAGFAGVLALRDVRNRREEWEKCLVEISEVRPTAANLRRAVDRLRRVAYGLQGEKLNQAVTREALSIAREDEGLCEAIAEHGLNLVPGNGRALTHCNTGFLVSYGIGTALGILRRAFNSGRLKQVYACESRPLGQGARLTIWELDILGIPGTLLCDSAAGKLMEDGRVDFIILGADRVAVNGDTANKVGTFQLAVLAERFRIPFYVAAPSTTFDSQAVSGDDIPVEYRSASEVRQYQGARVTIRNADAYNPAFDITPGELITAIIREDGVFRAPYRFTE